MNQEAVALSERDNGMNRRRGRMVRDCDSQGFEPLQKDAREGGNVAGRTRRDIEKRSGKAVVTSENYKELAGKGQKKLRKWILHSLEMGRFHRVPSWLTRLGGGMRN